MNDGERATLAEGDYETARNDDVLEAPPLIRHATRDVLLAHAALLDSVLVSQYSDQEVFRLVKVHVQELEQWHKKYTGWRVQRGSTFFRLERHLHMVLPVFVDDKLKEARDFACLAWILWFAEKRYLAGSGKHQQFLLSNLTDEIQFQTQKSDEVGLDIRKVQDRYSMRRSLEYLIDLGCLQMLEGEVKSWAESSDQEQHEILFEFTPLAHSLIVAINEKRVNALHSSLREQGLALSPPLPQAAYEISPLVRAWRTLLLGPALLRYDDAEAFRVLTEQAERFQEELGATFGWSLELNHDYACIVRGGGISVGSGATISFNGAFDQILLLLCGKFREQVDNKYWTPDSYGCIAVTQWQILPLLSDLRQRYGAHWGATVQTISAEKLLEEVYQRMRQTGLLRGPDRDGNLLILPTAARYSVSYKTFQEAGEVPTTRSRERKRRSPLKNQQAQFDWSVPPMEEE